MRRAVCGGRSPFGAFEHTRCTSICLSQLMARLANQQTHKMWAGCGTTGSIPSRYSQPEHAIYPTAQPHSPLCTSGQQVRLPASGTTGNVDGGRRTKITTVQFYSNTANDNHSGLRRLLPPILTARLDEKIVKIKLRTKIVN